MSSANVEGMLREGVNALKVGRREEARALLLRAVELDQFNEEAWLWLSGVLDSLEDQRTALENVLAINPNNDRARQGLDYIQLQLGNSGSAPAPTPSFAPVAPAAPAAPPPAPPPVMSSGLSTSVEWGAPPETSSASASYKAVPGEPTPDVLDSWVSGLNLPPTSPGMKIPLPTAAPFGDTDLTDFDEDMFTTGPFRADEPEPPRQEPARPAGRQGGRQQEPRQEPRQDARPTPPPRRGQRRREAEPEFQASDIFAPSPAPPAERAPRAPRRESRPAPPPPEPAKPTFTVMFADIPADLMPTRLPGTVEGTPILLSLAVAALVLANIGLAAYFMIGLFA